MIIAFFEYPIYIDHINLEVPGMSISVLLVDDHKITREGLGSMLGEQPGIEVVAEAENGRSALKLAAEFSPQVIIMDVSLPDLNGIDATRKICKEFSKIKVIGLSMHSDKRFVRGMIQAGAKGSLLKSCSLKELIDAIHAVVNGHIYLCPEITGIVIEDYLSVKSAAKPSGSSLLTLREREVLQLIAEGMYTREIASHINVSVKTVETHRRQIMEKLGLHSVAELTKYAIREGLTSVEDFIKSLPSKDTNPE